MVRTCTHVLPQSLQFLQHNRCSVHRCVLACFDALTQGVFTFTNTHTHMHTHTDFYTYTHARTRMRAKLFFRPRHGLCQHACDISHTCLHTDLYTHIHTHTRAHVRNVVFQATLRPPPACWASVLVHAIVWAWTLPTLHWRRYCWWATPWNIINWYDIACDESK